MIHSCCSSFLVGIEHQSFSLFFSSVWLWLPVTNRFPQFRSIDSSQPMTIFSFFFATGGGRPRSGQRGARVDQAPGTEALRRPQGSLPSFTEFYRVLLGFTEFYRVLPSFTGFYRVLLSFTEFYWVLPSFT